MVEKPSLFQFHGPASQLQGSLNNSSVFNFFQGSRVKKMPREHMCFSSQKILESHNPYVEEADRGLSSEIFQKGLRSISGVQRTEGQKHKRYFLLLFVLAEKKGRHRTTLTGHVGGVTEYLISELQLGAAGGLVADSGPVPVYLQIPQENEVTQWVANRFSSVSGVGRRKVLGHLVTH